MPASPRRVVPLIALLSSALVLLVLWSGWLEDLELVAMDSMMQLRGPQKADPRIVICEIDAASIRAYGLWPWPRPRIARLIEGLAAGGATTIALDVMFAESTGPDPGGELSADDLRLAASLERAGGVVLGYYFRRRPTPGSPAAEALLLPNAAFDVARFPPGGFPNVPRRPSVQPNHPDLAEAADGQGFFSNERRRGVLRHYDLLVAHGGTYYPALALKAAGEYLEGRLELTFGQRRSIPRLRLAGRDVEHDEGGALWINYRGGAGAHRVFSALDVIEGRLPEDAVRDRLVFVGASEVGIGDLYATPFAAEVPGVEIHAHAADNLLNGDYIHDRGAEALISAAAVVLVSGLVCYLVVLIRHHLAGSLAAIALVALWPVLSYAAFAAGGRHLQILAPIASGLLSLVATLRYQVGSVDRTFRQYVSAGVADEMLRHPERVNLGARRQEMTVLFSDISGFTSISEKLEPEAVVHFLNELFTPMTRIVLAEGGTLDKYMGDALMAFFGAPVSQDDHALRACRAALGISRELDLVNARWRDDGRTPEGSRGVGIGIGLNSGKMAVGNMGSDDVFDYTVIGDNVNLGSRVEGLTRLYGCRILVTEATAKAAAGAFLFCELDRVRVKGKTEPVTIFELVGDLDAGEAARRRVERFGEGLAAYRHRDFAAAEGIFAGLLDEDADDGPAGHFRDLCRGYRSEPPPEDWDGVTTLSKK